MRYPIITYCVLVWARCCEIEYCSQGETERDNYSAIALYITYSALSCFFGTMVIFESTRSPIFRQCYHPYSYSVVFHQIYGAFATCCGVERLLCCAFLFRGLSLHHVDLLLNERCLVYSKSHCAGLGLLFWLSLDDDDDAGVGRGRGRSIRTRGWEENHWCHQLLYLALAVWRRNWSRMSNLPQVHVEKQFTSGVRGSSSLSSQNRRFSRRWVGAVRPGARKRTQIIGATDYGQGGTKFFFLCMSTKLRWI